MYTQVTRQLLRQISLLLLLCMCTYAQYPKENFNDFTKQFFKDHTFQIQRIKFPLIESVCYYDDSKGIDVCNDTIICSGSKHWTHMQYANGIKGATHKFYINEKTRNGKPTSKTKLIFMEFEQEESDFNLTLIFQNINGLWYLIKEKEWTL
jgi:hypothetical protein